MSDISVLHLICVRHFCQGGLQAVGKIKIRGLGGSINHKLKSFEKEGSNSKPTKIAGEGAIRAFLPIPDSDTPAN